MDNELGSETALFDFEEIADHLLEQGAQQSPAQVHGCLSGVLAAGAEQVPEAGLDALAQALELTAYGDLASELMRLYTVTGIAMQDDEFSFDLLMPDDTTAVDSRVEALAGWCSGFLAGVAHVTARAPSDWSSDAKEILEDIAQMTLVEIEPGDTEEESEVSYTEIIEYLRVAVLNLYFEHETKSAFSELARDPDEPLH